MREEIINWYKLEEKLPPSLISVIFKVKIKFNAKNAIRIGYYNPPFGFYICGFREQYNVLDNFVTPDNKYLTILEWTQIEK